MASKKAMFESIPRSPFISHGSGVCQEHIILESFNSKRTIQNPIQAAWDFKTSVNITRWLTLTTVWVWGCLVLRKVSIILRCRAVQCIVEKYSTAQVRLGLFTLGI